MIYLDNAATTLQKPAQVKEAMVEAFENCANSGRGGYGSSLKAAEYVYRARERIATLFGVEDCQQIIFTYNATYALNMAIKGVATRGSCIISGYEHNSVVRPLAQLRKNGISCYIARGRLFDRQDMIKKFTSQIKRNTKLAVMTHVSNVFGYILPIREIDEICYKKGIKLIVDASQSAGSVPLKMSELRACVCICAPGHKGLYGPQGTGILVCKNGEELKTIIEGGTGSMSSEMSQPDFMPDRLESGTQNIPGIAGLSEGVDYVNNVGVEKIGKHEKKLISYLAKELCKCKSVKVYAATDENLQGGVLSFGSDMLSADEIANKLSEFDIAVRSGLHCSPVAHETVGTQGGTVRVSVSNFTTENDILFFLEKIKKILSEK